MSAEEAIMQINMSKSDFIIFQNTDSKQINLIYKRPDGDLGIVETLI
jgi:putative sigma-54 modulation protein